MCEKEATWKAIDEIVALDIPFLCDEHMETESESERPEDNPCFARIVETDKMLESEKE
jgi:hypothetical protein